MSVFLSKQAEEIILWLEMQTGSTYTLPAFKDDGSVDMALQVFNDGKRAAVNMLKLERAMEQKRAMKMKGQDETQ